MSALYVFGEPLQVARDIPRLAIVLVLPLLLYDSNDET